VYLRIAEPQIRAALRDTRVVAIGGPRQSGKTTLARRFAKQGRKYVTLDNQTTLAAAKSDPVAFVRGLDRAVIDEVQRAPDLLLPIKQSVDEDRRPGRFLLTGSANLLTVKTIHESLAGRVEIIPLYPLGRSEQLGIKNPQFIAKAFRGAIPDTAEAPSKEKLSDWLPQEVIRRPSSDLVNADARIGTAPTSNRSLSAIFLKSPIWRSRVATHILEVGGQDTYERSLKCLAPNATIAQIGVIGVRNVHRSSRTQKMERNATVKLYAKWRHPGFPHTNRRTPCAPRSTHEAAMVAGCSRFAEK